MTLMNRKYWIIRFDSTSNEYKFKILHQPVCIDRGSGTVYEDDKICVSISTSSFPDLEHRRNGYLHLYVQGDDRDRDNMWIYFHLRDFGRLFKAMQNLGPIKTENGRIRLNV